MRGIQVCGLKLCSNGVGMVATFYDLFTNFKKGCRDRKGAPEC